MGELKENQHKPIGLMPCACVGPARVQCEGEWEGGYQSGGHTFPVLVRWLSFHSVFPGAFPACNPARSSEPLHTFKEAGVSCSVNHCTCLLWAPGGAQVWRRKANTVNVIILWSVLDSTCLSQRKHQDCSGLSLVPRKLSLPQTDSPQTLSRLIQAALSGDSAVCVADRSQSCSLEPDGLASTMGKGI